MARNWDLLNKIFTQIIEHPETWDQSTKIVHHVWRWNIAGHAMEIMNYDFNWRRDRIPVPTIATVLLCLSVKDGERLLDPKNNWSTLIKLLTKWAKQDGVELPALIRDSHVAMRMDSDAPPAPADTAYVALG